MQHTLHTPATNFPATHTSHQLSSNTHQSPIFQQHTPATNLPATHTPATHTSHQSSSNTPATNLPAECEEVKHVIRARRVLDVPAVNIESVFDLSKVSLVMNLHGVHVSIRHEHHFGQHIVEIWEGRHKERVTLRCSF